MNETDRRDADAAYIAACPHPEPVTAYVPRRRGYVAVPNYCPRCWTALVWERRG